MKAIHLLISGRVQGVNYRKSTQEEAIRLGVMGWVRNLPDGRVEAHVEGKPELVDQLINWCRHGPPDAMVSAVEELSAVWQGFSTFDVRR
jgi:acylphosphatase